MYGVTSDEFLGIIIPLSCRVKEFSIFYHISFKNTSKFFVTPLLQFFARDDTMKIDAIVTKNATPCAPSRDKMTV